MFCNYINPDFFNFRNAGRAPLTLIQHKLWYFLLSLAHKNLSDEKVHTASVSRIMNFLGNTKDTKRIKQNLLSLKSMDEKSLYAFEDLKIINNNVFYSYANNVKNFWMHPNIQKIAQELLQYKFNSKYALFLYELCFFYMASNQSQVISVDEFRKFMGIHERYLDFKLLKHYVINKAIRQINRLTSIKVKIDFINENNQDFLHLTISKKDTKKQINTSSLKQLHGTYLESKAYQMYDNLPEKVRQKLDHEYHLWCTQVSENSYKLLLSEKIKKIFLIQKLISSLEQDFELWSLSYNA